MQWGKVVFLEANSDAECWWVEGLRRGVERKEELLCFREMFSNRTLVDASFQAAQLVRARCGLCKR
jgi:hypothetical protein